ncbi:GNAT family N-acetyltransferase [Consotaella aegiceratis]|uniref:GNAT family N-acetyltransferase n=1 Tax=Consotaella aegiceratis TaxID=3097961 RepID=UPI002F3F2A19
MIQAPQAASPIHEWRRDGHLISTDRRRLDIDMIWRFLSQEAYWSPGIERALVECAIAGSMVLGLYEEESGRQVGFARILSDGARLAYLSDVFVLASHRGRGIGTWLIETALDHPQLRAVGRWMLATGDAHELYARFGFKPLQDTAKYMERLINR